jgi:hypothetical protein
VVYHGMGVLGMRRDRRVRERDDDARPVAEPR